MRVRKNAPGHKPDYPSQSQFAEYKRVLGVAAIGLSTMAGAAAAEEDPPRLDGDVAIVPRRTVPACTTSNAAPKTTEPARLRGEIAVTPPPLAGVPPMVPKKASTNAPACKVPAATNAAPPVGLKGVMPAPAR